MFHEHPQAVKVKVNKSIIWMEKFLGNSLKLQIKSDEVTGAV